MATESKWLRSIGLTAAPAQLVQPLQRLLQIDHSNVAQPHVIANNAAKIRLLSSNSENKAVRPMRGDKDIWAMPTSNSTHSAGFLRHGCPRLTGPCRSTGSRAHQLRCALALTAWMLCT